MSAAKVPASFPRPAPDTAVRAHPRQLRCRQLHHQPCVDRRSKTYHCQMLTDNGARSLGTCSHGLCTQRQQTG